MSILNLNILFQYYKTLNIVTPAAPLPYHIFYSIHLPPLTVVLVVQLTFFLIYAGGGHQVR